MKKNNMLFLVITGFICFCFSEPTLFDPLTKSFDILSLIASDYGPRNIPNATNYSNPHTGIDYPLAEGGKAYAVEAGDVTEIKFSGDNNQNTFITIGKWRYMHMVSDSFGCDDYIFRVYTDQPVLDSLGKPSKLKTIIIVFREKSGSVWTTTKAIHVAYKNDQYIKPFTFKDPGNNNQQVTTSNRVEKGEWIFCARDYGSPGPSSDHLHIDYNNGEKNPWRFIAHFAHREPEITNSFQ